MDAPILTTNLNDPNYQRVGGRLLKKISPEDSEKSDGVIKILLHHLSRHTVASQNGFIWAAAETYDRSTSLIIRVDNIWLAILAQLKPFIDEAFRILGQPVNAAPPVPAFTPRQLDDPELVAERLWDMVGAKLNPQSARVLMPDFSTTLHTDSVGAALILVGTQCKVQHHRVFSSPRKPWHRLDQELHGDTADWDKLRERFRIIRNWSRKLKEITSDHRSLLDRMLEAGCQFQEPIPHVAADYLDSPK
ncbi:hypothetical protein FACUT_9839 [Fusarium acutatum]|uniref:Uncharacterized protein n=1 Tax=Fusarium acutatum TaxID=78861 RepID=A0A8H4JGE2_9HYPO|nr:hypothetical protein FACUT_9839 [Fusarium acutatum]